MNLIFSNKLLKLKIPFLLIFIIVSSFNVQGFQQANQIIDKEILIYDSLVSRYRYFKPDSALYFVKIGLQLAKNKKDINGEALMLNQMGIMDDNNNNYVASKIKYLQALQLYQKTGFIKGISSVNIRLGVVETRKGNYDRSAEYILTSLKISEQNNYPFGMMESYLILAENYTAQKKYDLALSNLKKSEAISKTLPFSNITLNIYNLFGVIYRETKKYPQAISYLKKGILASNSLKYQGLNITLTNNLASVYTKTGRNKESIVLLQNALLKAREINNNLREMESLIGLGANYKLTNPNAALDYYQQALNIAKEKTIHRRSIEILSEMVTIQKSKKNFEKALILKEEEKTIADSFYYNALNNRVTDLQAAYELSKSQTQVKELLYANSKAKLKNTIFMSLAIVFSLILVFFGISYIQNKKYNRVISTTNTELKESNLVKDKLLSVLAHDLRSPFASIINLLYLIKENYVDEAERKDLIDKITVSSNAYLDTLNKLVKWGEAQLKGIRIEPKNMEVLPVIKENIELLNISADEKNISINLNIPSNVKVFVDKNHFDFVIRNLVANAIKFTKNEGTIFISTKLESDKYRFTVKDNGVGIPKGKLEKIFSLENMSSNGTNEEKGNSIGLLMCKEYLQANKGSIEVKSIEGEGSAFSFILPAAV